MSRLSQPHTRGSERDAMATSYVLPKFPWLPVYPPSSSSSVYRQTASPKVPCISSTWRHGRPWRPGIPPRLPLVVVTRATPKSNLQTLNPRKSREAASQSRLSLSTMQRHGKSQKKPTASIIAKGQTATPSATHYLPVSSQPSSNKTPITELAPTSYHPPKHQPKRGDAKNTTYQHPSSIIQSGSRSDHQYLGTVHTVNVHLQRQHQPAQCSPRTKPMRPFEQVTQKAPQPVPPAKRPARRMDAKDTTSAGLSCQMATTVPLSQWESCRRIASHRIASAAPVSSSSSLSAHSNLPGPRNPRAPSSLIATFGLEAASSTTLSYPSILELGKRDSDQRPCSHWLCKVVKLPFCRA